MLTLKFHLDISDASGAVLAKWLVAPGSVLSPGDPIAEVELEKASMELESAFAGEVVSLLVEEGSEVSSGVPILRLRPG